MTNKQDRRLGKGLAALLGSPMDEVVEAQGAVGQDVLLHINVYDIEDNPFQPRRDFSESEIASLSESLKEHEMLQPVLVRRVAGRYQLISGERRLRAAIQAGWDTVPARLREADDRLVAELAIVENLQRKDLNAIEKALSFKRYLEQHQCTQEDLAGRLKIDRSTIANLVRLLELPQEILTEVQQGRVTAGHARGALALGRGKPAAGVRRAFGAGGLERAGDRTQGAGEDPRRRRALAGPGAAQGEVQEPATGGARRGTKTGCWGGGGVASQQAGQGKNHDPLRQQGRIRTIASVALPAHARLGRRLARRRPDCQATWEQNRRLGEDKASGSC